MAAAQQLARAGHSVDLYEKADRIGGLLRYGIPEFKMEKRVLDRRLDQMSAEGVRFETDRHVGVNVAVEDLRHQFDALLLTGGATAARELVDHTLKGEQEFASLFPDLPVYAVIPNLTVARGSSAGVERGI